MITINSYVVAERAVYQGVSQGVEKLLKNVDNFKDPDTVVKSIVEEVMNELCDVMDFGQQPIRFTPDLIRKLWEAARDEESPKG